VADRVSGLKRVDKLPLKKELLIWKDGGGKNKSKPCRNYFTTSASAANEMGNLSSPVVGGVDLNEFCRGAYQRRQGKKMKLGKLHDCGPKVDRWHLEKQQEAVQRIKHVVELRIEI